MADWYRDRNYSPVSAAYRCQECNARPDWRLERRGDAVVTWTCGDHLVLVLWQLQRPVERTEIVVTVYTGPSTEGSPHRWPVSRSASAG
jgi:hypothetical protein